MSDSGSPRLAPWLPELHPVRRVAQVIAAAAVGFSRNETGDQAAALTYFTLISLVPLAAAFSVLLSAFFGGDAGLADAIVRALPYRSPALATNLRHIVEHARAGSFLGIVIFFLVAFRAWHRIEASINRVWRIHRPRRLRTRISSFLFVMFWGPLVLGLYFNTRLAFHALGTLAPSGWERGLGSTAAFVTTSLAFTMIHWKGPNARVRLVPAMSGGVAAALGGLVIRLTLARPWAFLKDLTNVYGPLAILLLLITGLYAFWIWFLFTVEITHAWQRSGRIPERHFGHLPPPEEDGVLAVRLAFAVADDYRRGEPPLDSDQWADRLDVGPDDLARVEERLERAEVLERDPTSRGLRPARDPARISALEAWRAVSGDRRFPGAAGDLLGELAAHRSDRLARQSIAGVPIEPAGVTSPEPER